MDNPKFILSNQKEESISIQRVNKFYTDWLSPAGWYNKYDTV